MIVYLIASLICVAIVLIAYLYFFQWSVSVPDYMAARHYRYGKPITEGPISGKRIVVIPSIDQVVMIDKRIQKTLIDNIPVITKERQSMSLAVTVIWKPINAAMTIESIRPEDIEPTFFKIAESVIKNESSKMNVDELLENRNVLAKNLSATLSEATDTWGISISSVNISNLVVNNEGFMKNMAKPKEIELERKAMLAQIEKELAIELRSIEKVKESELSKLESDKMIGIKREEIATILEQAQRERELYIAKIQKNVDIINAEISLIKNKAITDAEAEKIKSTILAETEGLREKIDVINTCTPNAIHYEISKVLPELYKNITMGDITLFGNNSNGGGGIDIVAASALGLLKKFGGKTASAELETVKYEPIVTENMITN